MKKHFIEAKDFGGFVTFNLPGAASNIVRTYEMLLTYNLRML